MLRVECVNPLDLNPSDVVAWRRMLFDQTVLSSPYLTPEWAQAVARRRNETQVAIFRDGERLSAFFRCSGPAPHPEARVSPCRSVRRSAIIRL